PKPPSAISRPAADTDCCAASASPTTIAMIPVRIVPPPFKGRPTDHAPVLSGATGGAGEGYKTRERRPRRKRFSHGVAELTETHGEWRFDGSACTAGRLVWLARLVETNTRSFS